MNTTEHLAKIKAYCQRNLEIAAKRTPGEWIWKDQGMDSAELIEPCIFLGGSSSLPWGQQHHNAAFISICAGAAEAGWRATIAAIDSVRIVLKTLSKISKLPQGWEGNAGADSLAEDAHDDLTELINEILAAYPLTMIQP